MRKSQNVSKITQNIFHVSKIFASKAQVYANISTELNEHFFMFLVLIKPFLLIKKIAFLQHDMKLLLSQIQFGLFSEIKVPINDRNTQIVSLLWIKYKVLHYSKVIKSNVCISLSIVISLNFKAEWNFKSRNVSQL